MNNIVWLVNRNAILREQTPGDDVSYLLCEVSYDHRSDIMFEPYARLTQQQVRLITSSTRHPFLDRIGTPLEGNNV